MTFEKTIIEFDLRVSFERREDHYVAKAIPPIVTVYGTADGILEQFRRGVEILIDSIEDVSGKAGIKKYLDQHGIVYTEHEEPIDFEVEDLIDFEVEEVKIPVTSVPIRRELANAGT